MKVNSKWKHLFRVFIIGIVEFGAYILFKPQDLETFFFVWILIPFVFLILNVVNVDIIDLGASMGTRQNNASQINYLAAKAAEIMTHTNPRTQRIVGGILDPLNLTYILFILVNIIAMISVI